MKQNIRYYSILLACLLFVGNIFAQTPQNRTSSTIIADVLAQLPAQNQSKYNQLMADLVSTGETGLQQLIGLMNPPGQVSNEKLEFAISGWTNFVANDAAKRAVAANVYAKELSAPIHEETKAFLIRQIEQIGDNNQIEALSAQLNNQNLVAPASQALAQFGTPESEAAIIKALSTASDNNKIVLVNALAQTKSRSEETVLIQLLEKTTNPELAAVIYTSLGRCGTYRALPILKSAAEKENYAYGKANATDAYLALLQKLSILNNKMVRKEANAVLKIASSKKDSGLQVAAMNVLMNVPSENKSKLIEYAVKSNQISVVTAALQNFNATQLDNKTKNYLLKQIKSASPEIQTAIIYWMGANQIEAAVQEIEKLRFSDDNMVQAAAVSSLSEINNSESLKVLATLMKSKNSETITLVKKFLLAFKGDISSSLASVYNDCTDEGKIAILQIIAERGIKNQYKLVVDELSNSNDTIKKQALSSLKGVVTDNNLSDIFALLEQSDSNSLSAIQDAANAALSYLPVGKQIDLISEKMNQSSKKYLYYRLLSNTGESKAMDIITAAYKNESGENKSKALEALTSWKSFDAIYPLLDVARNTKQTAEKELAVGAVIRIVAASQQTGAVKYLFLREAMGLSTNDAQKNEILRLLGNTGMYQALLFVSPFMDQPALKESAAVAAMNLALSDASFAGVKTTAILNKTKQTLSNPDAGYQRQSIDKYLAENPQSNEFASIFNGKNLDGWKGLVANPIKRAQMSKKELDAAQAKADKDAAVSWIIENGELLFTGKGDNLCTVKQYGDFDMLVDWKLYEGSEPDAGIYLRGTPQVQIWDTSRVNVGAQVGSGGLYNNQTNMSKPLKVADLKLGEWNTFRIKMIGDRVSVWLNGEMVVDNVIMENYWDRSQPIFPIEQIELQAHGSKVAYRDIFVKEIPRPEPFKLSKEEEKEGFKILFDGTNMHQWVGNTKDYVSENGNIVLYPSQSFGGNLYTKDEFGNFVFRFEFMLTPGANNGLGIRTPMDGDAAYVGMELQILDNEDPIYKDLQKYQYHGSVYGVIPAKRGFLKPLGEWNYQEVIANGDNIKITLNGTVILEGNIREASKNGTETIDHKNHPGLLNPKGHIGFLGHGSEVKFRNIRVKELK